MDKIFKVFTLWQLVLILIGFVLGALTGVATTSYLWVIVGPIFVAVAFFIIDKVVFSIKTK